MIQRMPPRGVGYIAFPQGNDMHVGVLDRLPGSEAVVHADIESVWLHSSASRLCLASATRPQNGELFFGC
jgi:hypothetical protein